MNRREFLCFGAACLLGVADGKKIVEASYYEPMIYKRFFQFTEYEERPVTDALVIHHTGFFDIGKPTDAQMQAVKELCRWLCKKYGLDPLGKGVIVGQRDLNDTACPGKNLYKRLGEIRRFCV